MRTKIPRGQTLVLSVLLLSLIVVGALALLSSLLADRQAATTLYARSLARDTADAGIDRAIWCLNNGAACASPYLGETGTVANGEYETTVSSPSSTTRVIESTGYVPSKTNPKVTKVARVTLAIDNTEASFNYGLQAGVGGLDLKNNNKITGNVFSGGSVTGDKSVITGDVVVTVGDPTVDATADPSVSPLNTLTFGTNGSTNNFLAQSFVPTLTEKIHSIDLKLAKHSSPTSTLTLYIYSDSSGNPGSDLTNGGQAISVTVPNDSPAGWENGWTTQIFTPATNPVLAAGVTYWIVMSTSSTNASKYWVAARDTDNASYASGQAKLDGDTTSMPNACASAGCDIAFRVNLGGVSNTLKVGCTGAICIDGKYAIGGNGYAETIDSTNIQQHACYKSITGTVKAGKETETCTGSSTAPVPCEKDNTKTDTAPFCHYNNPTIDPVGFPLTSAQITQMEGQAATGGEVDCSAGCTISSGSIGPKKYIGNVTISGNVTLTGTIWVKGNLTVDSTITLSNTYGSGSGTIIADNPDDPINSGRIIIGNGGNALGNSTPDTYIMLLAMSKMLTDDNGAVDVSNNLTAGVVYGANGSVVLKNSADLKEVTGQRIVLQNDSEITYETGLASVVFTSGPGASWVMRPGSYQTIE
jgi:hypothetical protein